MARAVGAQARDTLVLTFDPTAARATAIAIPAGTAGSALLEQILRRSPVTLNDVAECLDCSPADVAAVLSRRGDTTLAAAVSQIPG